MQAPHQAFVQDPIELAGLFEGDIILSPHDGIPGGDGDQNQGRSEEDEPTVKNAIVRENQKWAGGVIPYFISAQFSKYLTTKTAFKLKSILT
jgi:hypothetical protein